MSIAAFSEERFPLRVAFGTSGGPERRTEIVRLSSGFETRNQRYRHSFRRYDAGSGVKMTVYPASPGGRSCLPPTHLRPR